VNNIHRITGQVGQFIGKGMPLRVKEPAYTHTKLARSGSTCWQRPPRTPGRRLVPDHLPQLNGVQLYDTRTIEKDITAVMAVTFRVE